MDNIRQSTAVLVLSDENGIFTAAGWLPRRVSRSMPGTTYPLPGQGRSRQTIERFINVKLCANTADRLTREHVGS